MYEEDLSATVSVVVRFPVVLRDQARDAAKMQDLTLSQLVRRAVLEYLGLLDRRNQ